MYGDSSAPNCYREDLYTGELTADEKGLVLRPDGTYYLRTELGEHVIEEHGRQVMIKRE